MLHPIPALAGNRPAIPADAGLEINKNTAPTYNIAPTVDVPFVTAGENGNHKTARGRWWLVPWWVKGMSKAERYRTNVRCASGPMCEMTQTNRRDQNRNGQLNSAASGGK
jgi:putative SOS response-associated peptidase YedK